MLRPGLRLLLLAVASVIAVVVALQMAAGRPGSGVATTTETSPASPPAQTPMTIHQSAATSASPGVAPSNPLPNLGQHINDETGAVARGQMNILDELERAIADQVRAIIRHAQGH